MNKIKTSFTGELWTGSTMESTGSIILYDTALSCLNGGLSNWKNWVSKEQEANKARDGVHEKKYNTAHHRVLDCM